MHDLNPFGKLLIVSGAILLIIGILIVLGPRIPFLGKLPGDFSWKGRNWSIYFPLGTSILLSILLSLLLYLFRKH